MNTKQAAESLVKNCGGDVEIAIKKLSVFIVEKAGLDCSKWFELLTYLEVNKESFKK